MFPLLLLGILGLALASRRGSSSSAPSSSAKPAATSTDIAKRIVQETKEILDGKREAYTDDPEDVQAELERARAAVALAKQKEAQTPASSSSSTPRPAPKPASTMSVGPITTQTKPAAAAKKPAPAGTDLALAKSTAAKMAAHLKQAGRDKYDRKALKLWQTRAGLAPDGIYGKGTAAALKYFGAAAPAPFFNQGTASYTPPA